MGEGGCGVSANEYSYGHGAQMNFGDLTPYLTYDYIGLQTKLLIQICVELGAAVS
jgi:hypothetical protein